MAKDILIIDRSIWRTGSHSSNRTGNGRTKLLNKEGFMCCLGMRCEQLGIPKKDLLGVGAPAYLSKMWEIPDLLSKSFNSSFATEAMEINDDRKLTSKRREYLIRKHFLKKNILVSFKGKYSK